MTPAADQLFSQLRQLCPAKGASSEVVTVVVDAVPLGKLFDLIDGKATKKAAVTISNAVACQFHVPDLETLRGVLEAVSMSSNAAITNCGWKPVPVGEPFRMVSRKGLEAAGLDPEGVHVIDGVKVLARLKLHATASCWQVVDRDVDEHTPVEFASLTFETWRVAMDQILPEFSTTACLRALSSSSRVFTEDGKPVGGGNGHAWVRVANPDDVERVRLAMLPRAAVAGKLWQKPKMAKDGSGIVGYGDATICDPAVWVLGRLVFNGCPVAGTGLTVGPQQFDMLAGTAALDTSLVTVSPLETLRATVSTRPMVVRNSDGIFGAHRTDLRLDTVLELADGSTITVQEAIRRGVKLRCQAPFRASISTAAFFNVGKDGTPFVYDSGTGIKYTLERPKHSPTVAKVLAGLTLQLEAMLTDDNKKLARYCFDDGVIADIVDNSFWRPESSKLYAMRLDGSFSLFTQPDALRFGLDNIFGSPLAWELTAELLGESAGEVLALAMRKCVEAIITFRQAKVLHVRVDMFCRTPSLSFADDTAFLVLPHRPFTVPGNFSETEVFAVWADFVDHFPDWPGLVEFLVASRFIESTRRRCFAWVHAQSDFGKGVIIGAMKQLGLSVELTIPEMQKAMNGEPSGVALEEFRHAWAIHVDEWKTVNANMKLLNDSMTVAPKNQMRGVVPLYAKLFFSAEDNTALTTGGVEQQFTERFSYVGTPPVKFDQRELVQRIGANHYRNCLAAGLAMFLNDRVATMRALGRHAADLTAMAYVQQFHDLHLITAKFGDYTEEVESVAEQMRACAVRLANSPSGYQDHSPLNKALRLCPQGTFDERQEGGKMKERKAIVLLTGFVDAFIREAGGSSGTAKLSYKRSEIVRLVDQGGNKEHRYSFGNQRHRGPLVFLDGGN